MPHSAACRTRIETAMQTTPTGADRVRQSGQRQRAHVDRAIERDDEQATKRQRVAAEGGEAEVDPERPHQQPQSTATGPHQQPQSTATGTAAPGTPILPQHPDPDTDMIIDPVQQLQDPADDTMDRPDDPGASSSTAPAPGGAAANGHPGPSATSSTAPREEVHLERRGENIRVYTKDSNVDMATVGDNGVQEWVTCAHIAIDEDVAALGGTGGREWVNSHRTEPRTTKKDQKKDDQKRQMSETFERCADMKEWVSSSCTARPNDISEIYSPPLVTKLAEKHGLTPGWSLDLTVPDERGIMWDFTKAARREDARRLVQSTRPKVLIGSPMCKAFSALQALNRSKRDPEVVRRELVIAEMHLRFCCEPVSDTHPSPRD